MTDYDAPRDDTPIDVRCSSKTRVMVNLHSDGDAFGFSPGLFNVDGSIAVKTQRRGVVLVRANDPDIQKTVLVKNWDGTPVDDIDWDF